MKEEIKVSIIIPVYNVEKYLRKCIESALNQTLDNIEIIAVNDGSTDSSLQLLTEYESTYENFKVINQVNMGLSGARNAGFKYSRGKYVYFLDSDDYIDSKLAEICYNVCENNKAEVSMFDADVFFERDLNNNNLDFNYKRKDILTSNVVTGEELFCKLIKNKCYKSPVWLFFYNRQFLINNDLKFYNGIIHEDELFTPQVLLRANRIIYIPKDLFFRRVRNDSIMTKKISRKNIEGYYIVAEELYKFSEIMKNKINKITYKILIRKIVELYSTSFKNCYILGLGNEEYNSLEIRIKKSILEKKNLKNLKLKLFIMWPYLMYKISKIKRYLSFKMIKLGGYNG
ncbi:glycosyltransferase [Clostridium butyricum]|uniref:glycosyltransferase n=2 Tax=Clostridium butyricum TaxID=1492 RepID=UPI00136815DF|nr:glycosyltransferase [Clostridium butyricum]MBO1686307.1 glycosyltransferase [Clostridium butyricum]MZI79721.1 glycosyltransferase [Clostridium butyricum]